jgi:hypothetical protein
VEKEAGVVLRLVLWLLLGVWEALLLVLLLILLWELSLLLLLLLLLLPLELLGRLPRPPRAR